MCKKRAKKAMLLLCLLGMFAAVLTGCAPAKKELQDGYYTAQAAEFDNHGWKEFVIICVQGGRVITVEYNATDPSGFIKSWDMDYMRIMNEEDGTYPNEYTRIYKAALLNHQNPDEVDMISGATHSHNTFQLLARAALQHARTGNKNIAYVDIPIYED